MSALHIADDFRVDPADFNHDLAAIRAVREPVFLVEQQVPPELEWDALDPLSKHVLARDLNGQPIGTARLTPEHRIGRMAVLANWRGKGVGEAMLMRLLDQARDLGYPQIELHSQTHAMAFYARAGFTAEGEEFMEAGIPHQIMRMALEPREPLARRAPTHMSENAIDTFVECCDTTLSLLRETRHRLYLFTHDLDAAVLCREPALEQLRRIATSGRGADIRIIVQDPAAGLRPAAQLIGLAQRAPTTVIIRTPLEEVDLNLPAGYLVNDVGGYLFRPIATRFEGTTHAQAFGRNRQLHDTFEKVWERSESPVELRALKL